MRRHTMAEKKPKKWFALVADGKTIVAFPEAERDRYKRMAQYKGLRVVEITMEEKDALPPHAFRKTNRRYCPPDEQGNLPFPPVKYIKK
jgi:hypothetical protein